MEMLVVITLFSILMLTITQIFASFNQLHRRIANRAVLSEDLRFTIELLVRAARNNAISYASSPLTHDSQIRLTQANGVDMVIKRSSAGDSLCNDVSTIACLLLSTDGGTTWAPLTGKHVNVQQFDVYVAPSQSPFVSIGGSYPNNIQPFVTFHLKTQYVAADPRESSTLEAQTTVSSRVYLR